MHHDLIEGDLDHSAVIDQHDLPFQSPHGGNLSSLFTLKKILSRMLLSSMGRYKRRPIIHIVFIEKQTS